MDGQQDELVDDESCAREVLFDCDQRFQFLNTLHRLIYFTVVCSGANFLIQEMDFFHTSFAFCSNFFFSKCSPKLGCILYTGAYYTWVNTVVPAFVLRHVVIIFSSTRRLNNCSLRNSLN